MNLWPRRDKQLAQDQLGNQWLPQDLNPGDLILVPPCYSPSFFGGGLKFLISKIRKLDYTIFSVSSSPNILCFQLVEDRTHSCAHAYPGPSYTHDSWVVRSKCRNTVRDALEDRIFLPFCVHLQGRSNHVSLGNWFPPLWFIMEKVPQYWEPFLRRGGSWDTAQQSTERLFNTLILPKIKDMGLNWR